MWRSAIVQLGIKELRSVRHDAVLLGFMIWAFSFGIYSAATAVSRELHQAPIAVVDEDRVRLVGGELAVSLVGHGNALERLPAIERQRPGEHEAAAGRGGKRGHKVAPDLG